MPAGARRLSAASRNGPRAARAQAADAADPHALLSPFQAEAGAPAATEEPERRQVARPVRAARLCGRGRRRARHRRQLRHARQLPLAEGARRLPRDRRLGRRAAVVGRTIGATGISYVGAAADFPREHRPSCGQGHRAAVRRLGHLLGSLLSGRRCCSTADRDLRRADGRARSGPARPAAEVRLFQGSRASMGRSRSTTDAEGHACARGRRRASRQFPHDRSSSASSASATMRCPTIRPSRRLRSAPTPTAAGVDPDVAVYSVSGWYGRRRLRQRRDRPLPHAPQSEAASAAWSVGSRRARQWVAVARSGRARVSAAGRDAALLRPLPDGAGDTGLEREAPVHYFAMHARSVARAADSGRRAPETSALYLAPAARLAAAPCGRRPATNMPRRFAVRHRHASRATSASPRSTRASTTPTGTAATSACCVYTSAPLSEPTRVWPAMRSSRCGCESDQPDAAIHVYLEEVEADGRCRYVTEGMLRALHRKTAPCPEHHKTTWPWRTLRGRMPRSCR